VSNTETSGFETHLRECYLLVDDYLQSNPKVAAWRRSTGGDSDFTDAEVIVIALTGGYFRTDTLKRTYQLAIANTEGLFPTVPGTSSGFAACNGCSTRSADWSGRPTRAR